MKKTQGYMLKSAIAAAATLFSLHANVAFAVAPSGTRGSDGVDISQLLQETDRLIVRYRDNATSRKSAAAASMAKSRVQEVAKARGLIAKQLRTNGLGAQIWTLDKPLKNADVQAIARAIAAADLDVEYAEPDRRMQAAMIPNDALFGYQWDLQNTAAGINAPGAWAYGMTGAGVVVGVIDTGYRPHADLAANILPGYDFVSDANNAMDGNGRDPDAQEPGGLYCQSNWHGTHVAGTIAAVTNNGQGVAGIAYGAKILPLRVLGCQGGHESDIADAILWGSGNPVAGIPANPTPARVLNLSLSGTGACGYTYSAAINAARNRGTVVVVAAGNNGKDASQFTPANCPGVVAVAATDNQGKKAVFSNFGANVSLAAPGTDIVSTYNAGTSGPGADLYETLQGTSMAAPHVAAVAALMLQAKPTMTGVAVETVLKSTTKPFPYGCASCGSGILDAQAAVTKAINYATTIVPNSIYKTRSGTGTVSASATVEPIGAAPFTYVWSTMDGFALTNATSPTVQISAYLEVCGRTTLAMQTGTLTVTVTDSQGMVTRANADVDFRATNTTGGYIPCM